MSTQALLELGGQAPVISQEEILLLTSWLHGRGWVRGAEICAALNLDEREIRAIAEASDGMIVSGPGCPGYMLLTSASQIADVDRAASRLESQANRMHRRAYAMRRRAHALLG